MYVLQRIKINLVVFLGWCVFGISAQRNNVCPRAEDYDTLQSNSNCWYNPDVELSVPEIILRHAYPLEIYDVITNDGYILQLFRIPHGKNVIRNKNEILQPVLLQHGFAASAAQWVITGNTSLGYIMADDGYDVWMINHRGNMYSKRHIMLSSQDPQYWDFSFREMAIYDIPAVLDVIYQTTGRNDIIMIGHSLGTTNQINYAALMPEHSRERVKYMVHLGPAIFIESVTSSVRIFVRLLPAMQKLLNLFGSSEIFTVTRYSREFLSKLCFNSNLLFSICEFVFLSIVGFNFDITPDSYPLIFAHFPAGASLKLFINCIQSIPNRGLAWYDYGPELNLKYYHTEKPPMPNVSNVEIPGLIVYGQRDAITTRRGAFRLFQELPPINSIYEVSDSRYNHFDFFIATNVVQEVFANMFQVLNRYKVTYSLHTR